MRELKFVINQYIIDNWFWDYKYPNGKYKYTEFAKDHYFEEKLARKIVSSKGYAAINSLAFEFLPKTRYPLINKKVLYHLYRYYK